ncbi:uncharacterized protein LOC107720643, partial [Sinocyclocheilus rhinocerous]|uniref:uncharacterized protein LOC107720643 n=1 Tax=Sinocyclocheilus rhinocerous TaxID=307959 RepID=UPI0007B8A62B
TIIDTPGYGNTEGSEKDREISEYLTKLFSAEDGIHYIDAVCFVMKTSQNRLSEKEFYIFHSVLSILGKDIENSIMFLMSQSDGLPPTDALNAIKTAEIPSRKKTKKQPFHFVFNNRQKEKRDKKFDHIYRLSWEMGERSINELFTLLEEKNRKSVQLTLDVLKERSKLEVCVDNLKERISENELKIKELNQIQEALRQNGENIKNCKNSEVKVNRSFKEKVSIENASWRNRNATCCSVCEENCHENCWFATCCSICEENCHENCWWVNDLSWCEAMRNYNCTVCTGKCHYSKHVRENKKYVMKTKEDKMKFEEFEKEYEHNGDQNGTSFNKEEYENIKKKLENNMKESENKTKEEEKLKSELENNKNEKSKLLHDAYISIVSLSKVAL